MDQIDDILGLIPPKKTGKFTKGKSGNNKGRPPKQKVSSAVYKRIVQEANGDPIKFQQLALQNAFDLGIDVKAACTLAKELAPYEKPKKASLTVDENKSYQFRIVDPTKDIKLIENEEDSNDPK